MNAERATLGRVLLLLLVVAWPWDVYQYVPLSGIHLTDLTGALLVSAFLADVLLSRTLRIPFELVWPVLLLIGLVWVVGPDNSYAISASLLLVLLLAVLHFTSGRGFAWRCLAAAAASAALVALVSNVVLVLRPSTLIPTAYSLDTGAVLFGARDLSSGVWTSVVCMVIAAWIVSSSRLTRWQRAAGLAAGVVLAVSLVPVGKAMVVRREAWCTSVPMPDNVGEAIVLVVAVWLVARVAAKLAVEWLESRQGRLLLPMTILGLTVLLFLVLPLRLRAPHAVMLGLAAGAAGRKGSDVRVPRLAWALPLPLAALAAVNAFRVFPENRTDPRNYDVSAAQDLARADYGRLARRMDHFDALSPGERRTHLWRANAALEQGQYRHATAQFAASLEPSEPQRRTILPRPSAEAAGRLQMRLRDVFSSRADPAGHLGYERVLVAQGNLKGAVNLLRMRVRETERDPLNVSAAPFAEAVAFLLGNPEASETLAEWTAADLVTVLRSCGAQVRPAPPDVPRPALPVVLIAYTTATTLEVRAAAFDEATTARCMASVLAHSEEPPEWSAIEAGPNTSWTFELRGADTEGAYVRVRVSDGAPPCAVTTPEADAISIPDSTAMLIWLPERDS